MNVRPSGAIETRCVHTLEIWNNGIVLPLPTVPKCLEITQASPARFVLTILREGGRSVLHPVRRHDRACLFALLFSPPSPFSSASYSVRSSPQQRSAPHPCQIDFAAGRCRHHPSSDILTCASHVLGGNSRDLGGRQVSPRIIRAGIFTGSAYLNRHEVFPSVTRVAPSVSAMHFSRFFSRSLFTSFLFVCSRRLVIFCGVAVDVCSLPCSTTTIMSKRGYIDRVFIMIASP